MNNLFALIMGIIALLLCLALGASVLFLAWNFIVSPIFGIVELSWLKCFGVAVVCWLIKMMLK